MMARSVQWGVLLGSNVWLITIRDSYVRHFRLGVLIQAWMIINVVISNTAAATFFAHKLWKASCHQAMSYQPQGLSDRAVAAVRSA